MAFAYLHRLVLKIDGAAYDFPGGMPAAGEVMVDLLYFSMVTILTLGFGDIVPVTPFARMLTVMEAFVGAFFIAILVSRLISQGSNHDVAQEAKDTDDVIDEVSRHADHDSRTEPRPAGAKAPQAPR